MLGLIWIWQWTLSKTVPINTSYLSQDLNFYIGLKEYKVFVQTSAILLQMVTTEKPATDPLLICQDWPARPLPDQSV